MMFKQASAVALGWVCGLGMGAMLYAKAAQDLPQLSNAQTNRQRLQIQRLKRNIDRLENELADQKDKLAVLDRDIIYLGGPPPPPSELAIVGGTSDASAIVGRGKRDGFRLSDKLVFINRTNTGPIIDGLGFIGGLNEKDFVAGKTAQFPPNNYVGPGDEAYIINRENSRYSLVNARLWPYPKKSEK